MADGWVTIASDVLSAAINPTGAELCSLTDGHGREFMTDADLQGFAGEFAEKPGLVRPAPGAVRSFHLSITVNV